MSNPGQGAPLNGWRGIADYLGRDVSTAKRWASTRDLPVHRVQGSAARKGVPVYAFAHELDAWIKGEPGAALETVADGADSACAPELAAHAVALPNRRHLVFGALAAGLTASGGGLLAWRSFGDPGRDNLARHVPDRAALLHAEATYLWQKRTPETLQRAADLLKDVLQIEPGFAAAQADLAVVYNLMVEYGAIGVDEGYRLSWEAAEQAVRIEPDNARAHTVLGDIRFFRDRDYDGGIALLQRAVSLDRTDAIARQWLASALMAQASYNEAAVEIEAARVLEPLSRSIIVSQAMIELGLGRPYTARQILEKLIQNEPTYRSPYRFLAFAELAIENYPGYLAALHQRFSLTNDPAGLRVAAAGVSGWQNGRATGMVQAIAATMRANRSDLKDPYFIAHWLALSAAWTEAAEQLAEITTRHYGYLPVDPAFAAVQHDRALQEIFRSVNLPVDWARRPVVG